MQPERVAMSAAVGEWTSNKVDDALAGEKKAGVSVFVLAGRLLPKALAGSSLWSSLYSLLYSSQVRLTSTRASAFSRCNYFARYVWM